MFPLAGFLLPLTILIVVPAPLLVAVPILALLWGFVSALLGIGR